MTGVFKVEATPPFDEVPDIVNRTRAVDPTAREDEIRRYFLEIDKARAMLDSLESSGAAPLECFSALWPRGSER